MAGRLAATALAAAVVSEAFLLPPTTSSESAEPDLSTWTLVDPNSQLLIVPCQGCKVDGSAEDSSLLLNLTVGAKPGTIELGGEVVYPVSFANALKSNPLVLEVPTDASLADIQNDISKYSENENVVTGWMFGTTNEIISEDGDEILSVNLDITSIGANHVQVPHVSFKILKNPQNHMMILSSDVAEMETGSSDKEECTTRLCRWREIIEDRLHGIASSIPKPGKGCSKGTKGMMGGTRPPTNMHHGPHSHHDGANRQPLYEHGPHHPHAGQHHGHGHHHSKLHRFMHRFVRLFMAVAIPILIGIFAGVLTYVVGMVIGCGIALLWIKFRRGGRRGYGSVALDEQEAVIKELDVNAEPRESFESAPPVYEDAPAYEEKEARTDAQ